MSRVTANHDDLNGRERRAHRRYPVGAEVEFRVGSARRPAASQAGRGQCIDLSTCGILFTSDISVPLNARVEFSIAWPAPRNSKVALELYAAGRVVRAGNRQVAVQIQRSMFRLRKPENSMRPAGLAG